MPSFLGSDDQPTKTKYWLEPSVDGAHTTWPTLKDFAIPLTDCISPLLQDKASSNYGLDIQRNMLFCLVIELGKTKIEAQHLLVLMTKRAGCFFPA